MSSTVAPGKVIWHVARVSAVSEETPTARRIELDIPTWPGNDAGAHLDVRLTAPDGYQAARSYSIASSGAEKRVVIAVDEVPDGEVSPYLVRALEVGDELEVRGPLGRFFLWFRLMNASQRRCSSSQAGPALFLCMRWRPLTISTTTAASSVCSTRCERAGMSSSAKSWMP